MKNITPLGIAAQRAVRYVEQIVLIFIAIATAYASLHEIYKMWSTTIVGVGDLLLLFLYLEVLSMVKHYLGSGKLAVRYPLYIGMVALARYMVLEVKTLSPEHILAVSGAVLVMALAVLAVRFGHVRYPYTEDGDNPNVPIIK